MRYLVCFVDLILLVIYAPFNDAQMFGWFKIFIFNGACAVGVDHHLSEVKVNSSQTQVLEK